MKKIFKIEKELKDNFELVKGSWETYYSPKLSEMAGCEVYLYLAASDDLCITCIGWGFEESYNLGNPTTKDVVDFLRSNYLN